MTQSWERTDEGARMGEARRADDGARRARRVSEESAERCVRVGQYIAETGATVREAAAHFGMSKSSVHKDVHERLPLLHAALGREVRAVLRYHMAVRHLRGGRATREKYRQKARKDEDALSI